MVAESHDLTTNLVATVNTNQITFSTNSAAAIPLNCIVKVEFDTQSGSLTIIQDAFYSTVAGDMPIGIATGVAAAITAAGILRASVRPLAALWWPLFCLQE